MQRDTGNTESITVEYGFLDSNKDDVNQLKNNWKTYAEAVVRAIIEYLNLTYVPVDNKEFYTVKSGDSLWSISKKFGISVDELKQLNNLNSTLLSIGQVLKVSNTNKSNDEKYYTVKKGDSLYKIAQSNNVTVNELMNYNNLTSTNLSIGDVLKIPKVVDNLYVVKKGDSLYKIAKENNITIDELKQTNNLTNNILTIGQKLIIPSLIESNLYIVKSGDTLYKIAQNNNITVSSLMNLNNLTTTNLTIGQKLKLK